MPFQTCMTDCLLRNIKGDAEKNVHAMYIYIYKWKCWGWWVTFLHARYSIWVTVILHMWAMVFLWCVLSFWEPLRTVKYQRELFILISSYKLLCSIITRGWVNDNSVYFWLNYSLNKSQFLSDNNALIFRYSFSSFRCISWIPHNKASEISSLCFSVKVNVGVCRACLSGY